MLWAKYIKAVPAAKMKIVYEKILMRPYLSLKRPNSNPPKRTPHWVIVVIHPAWTVEIPRLAMIDDNANDMKLKSMFSKEKPVAVEAITNFCSLLRLGFDELFIKVPSKNNAHRRCLF